MAQKNVLIYVVGVVVEETRKLMHQMQVSEIMYTARAANMAAHVVANYVAQDFGRLCWLGDGPSLLLVQVIEYDKPVWTEVLSREVCHGTVYDRSFPQI